MSGLTVAAETASRNVFGVRTSDMQTGISVSDNAVTGTLKYMSESNAITDKWGAGNFLVLKFSDIDERATSVMVGLDPSESSGLVELIGDPDMNGVFKVTDKDTQVFKIVSTDGTRTTTQTFDLSGLTCQTE